jgi:hypothetical protein
MRVMYESTKLQAANATLYEPFRCIWRLLWVQTLGDHAFGVADNAGGIAGPGMV